MKQDDLVNEYRIKMPSLRKMIELNYVNPKTDGKKIYAEKSGKLFIDGEIKAGSYYLYKDEKMPNKYITVFVNSSLNEDGETVEFVHVMGFANTLQQGINKIRYRLNTARKNSQ